MENNNQMQNIEAQKDVSLLCAPPCNGTICVPLAHYDELVRAESELSILRRAYQTMGGFTVDYILDTIFDPALKYKRKADLAPLPETETTSTESTSSDVE